MRQLRQVEHLPDGLQYEIDRQNRDFWNELCGSSLARSLSITEITPESLQRFDDAYMRIYPYLYRYVPTDALRGRRVLEIGPGYGTLGQLLASRGCHYIGLDIAAGPVAMMRYRLADGSGGLKGTALQGSALELPFADGTFDYIYTIGCLHHTGSLPKAVSEIHRVLARGGQAIVMLYHRYSFRRLAYVPVKYLLGLLSGNRRYRSFHEFVRGLYDASSKGEPAPHTDFVSRREAKKLFKDFSQIRIESQNFDTYVLLKGRAVFPREMFLNNLGRVLGVDLYIVATK